MHVCASIGSMWLRGLVHIALTGCRHTNNLPLPCPGGGRGGGGGGEGGGKLLSALPHVQCAWPSWKQQDTYMRGHRGAGSR